MDVEQVSYLATRRRKLADGSYKVYVNRNSYTRKVKKPLLDDEQLAEVRRLLEMRVPTKVIAQKFGISYYKLRRLLKHEEQ